MYSIEFDEKSRLLLQRTSGFWDLDEVARYERELTAVLTRLKSDGRPFTTLYDNRHEHTQSAEVMQAFAKMAGAEIMQPMGRVAIMVTSVINKLQAERISPNPMVKVFHDEAEARQWLAETREASEEDDLASRHPGT